MATTPFVLTSQQDKACASRVGLYSFVLTDRPGFEQGLKTFYFARFIAFFTACAISFALIPYFSISSAGVPDSPKLS